MHDILKALDGFQPLAKAHEIATKGNKGNFHTILEKEHTKLYGTKLKKLSRLSDTRWNSAFYCVQSVYAIKGALLKAVPAYNSTVAKKLKIDLQEEDFSMMLLIGDLLRPIVKKSFKMQSGTSNMADVLLMYLELYYFFVSLPVDPYLDEKLQNKKKEPYPEDLNVEDTEQLISENMFLLETQKKGLEVLKKRFNQLEHPIFLLTWLLDPIDGEASKRIVQKMKPPAFEYDFMAVLSKLLLFYARKLLPYRSFNQTKIVAELNHWISGSWKTNKHVLNHHLTDRYEVYAKSKGQYWLDLATSDVLPNLAKLGHLLTTTPVQAANCESLFSQYGKYRTKYRSRLHMDHVEDMHIIRIQTRADLFQSAKADEQDLPKNIPHMRAKPVQKEASDDELTSLGFFAMENRRESFGSAAYSEEKSPVVLDDNEVEAEKVIGIDKTSSENEVYDQQLPGSGLVEEIYKPMLSDKEVDEALLPYPVETQKAFTAEKEEKLLIDDSMNEQAAHEVEYTSRTRHSGLKHLVSDIQNRKRSLLSSSNSGPKRKTRARKKRTTKKDIETRDQELSRELYEILTDNSLWKQRMKQKDSISPVEEFIERHDLNKAFPTSGPPPQERIVAQQERNLKLDLESFLLLFCRAKNKSIPKAFSENSMAYQNLKAAIVEQVEDTISVSSEELIEITPEMVGKRITIRKR